MISKEIKCVFDKKVINKIDTDIRNHPTWLLEQTERVKVRKAHLETDIKTVEKIYQNREIYDLYVKRIYERYNDLLKAGKKPEDMTNMDLWKIFEYFTCIKLTNKYKKQFYEYEDIDPTYKENNGLTKNDTGIDASNLEDTIVQCKLRAQSLTWNDCSTFFGSQVGINEQTNKKKILFENMIIARNSECKIAGTLKTKTHLFEDVTFSKEEIIDFCNKLIKNPPVYQEPKKEKFILRDYQVEAINFIKNSTRNCTINIPLGLEKIH